MANSLRQINFKPDATDLGLTPRSRVTPHNLVNMRLATLKPLRVLMVDNGIGFGGAIVSLTELARALKKSCNVEPIIVTSQSNDVLGGLLGDVSHIGFWRPLTYRNRAALHRRLYIRPLPVVVARFGMKLYSLLDALVSLVNSTRLCFLMVRANVHVVHVNNGWIEDVIRAASWARIPAVVHWRAFSTDDVERTVRRNSHLRATVKHQIAISDAVRDSVLSSGVLLGPITTIYNPIRVERYREGESRREEVRASLGFGEGMIVASIFGRITSWKGQLEFLEVALTLSESLPNLRLLLVGDESDADDIAYAKRTSEVAARCPEGLVAFAGYRNCVEEYYWASDIVVHNSQSPEPFGRVVSEAMACGRAVIAMNEGGPPEILSHGEDGLLVAPRDNAALASALSLLCNDTALRNRLGRNAVETVRRRFASDRIADQVREIFAAVAHR